VLSYANFSSLSDALLTTSAMPKAMSGGIIALCLIATPFSRIGGYRLRCAPKTTKGIQSSI
jgi:Cu/Ag efflux pump CusA